MQMQSQPQPIASNSRNNDYNMAGSYTGTGANGSFNPSSYTKHFLGSPLSWRPDSLGSQYYAGNQYNSADGQSDLKRMSTSYESERGAFYNALSAFDREGDLCRNYTCCGIHLNDLHALLEHFEEVHVVVIDPNPANPQTQVQIPFNPQPAPDPALFNQQQQMYLQQQQQQQQSLQQSSQQGQSAQTMNIEQIGPFDPDDMDIGLDTSGSSRTPSSGAPTPPETPVSTPQFSSYSNPALTLNVNATQPQYSNAPAYHSQPSSPSLISAFETTTVVPRAFLGAGPYGNPYLPSLGNSSSLANANGPSPHIKSNQPMNDMACGVAPAALFSSSSARQSGSSRTTSTSAHVTPNPSRVPSPSGGRYPNSSPPSPTHNSSADKLTGGVQRSATTSSRPSTSMLLSKPFRCPKPNCNKSYKQANGLKYHLTHGSCSFAPAREVEQVQALLAARSSSGANSVPGSPAIEHTEEELLEVEKEAERQLKPYACGVADCQRRYKNMNGLRYHYQHSGDHGAIGLALLASGQHEACARNGQSGVGRERRGGGSRAPSRASTPPNANAAVNPSQGHSVSGMNTPPHGVHGAQPYPTQGFAANAFNASLAQQQRQGPVALPVQMGFVGGQRYDLTGDVTMGMTQ